MRIALVSTPFVPVPPPRYGGTELVVAELALGLRDEGHDVTLFTCGGGGLPGVATRTHFPAPVWPPDPYIELEHAAFAADAIARGRFDVVHTHVPASLPLARFVDVPHVYTIHHDRDDKPVDFYVRQEGVQLVAISRRQRELLPELDGVEVVWHGLDPSRYPLGRGGRQAAFLGRLAPEKGPHCALDAAAIAGLPLLVAGQAHWKDTEYFRTEVEPRLGRAGARWVGELGHDAKVELLGGSLALLCPIAWEEPFGLVLVEAMLCGTPVLAYARGSVPEIVEEGVTGFVCADCDDMADKLTALADGRLPFDRARCRDVAVERFGRRRMVRDYVALYERVIAGRTPDVRAAVAGA